MKICETVFWISLLVIFYTYIGYGMLLYVLVRLKECFRQTPTPAPAGRLHASRTDAIHYCL